MQVGNRDDDIRSVIGFFAAAFFGGRSSLRETEDRLSEVASRVPRNASAAFSFTLAIAFFLPLFPLFMTFLFPLFVTFFVNVCCADVTGMFSRHVRRFFSALRCLPTFRASQASRCALSIRWWTASEKKRTRTPAFPKSE